MPESNLQQQIQKGGVINTKAEQNLVMNLGTISATTSPLKIVGVFPKNATITAVNLIVNTAITANDTNYWTFALTNKGTAGTGTTVLLAATDANTTKATGGFSMVAYDTTAATVTTTATDLNVSQGDVIVLTATKAASAANLVDLSVEIVYKERT